MKNKEAALRALVLASALVIGSLSLASQADAARPRHNPRHAMTLKLANGRTVTFQLMRMGGRMMAVAPASEIDPFHFASER
ncbi:MAG: hypothetical protein WBX25_02965 [Rhodomicrobium sp.]